MRLTNTLLETVISDTAGPDVVPLVMKLKNKKNFSEFKLAESLKQEVNLTRNMLYRLLKHNLVSFIRRKDKKKGWYIYYWTFRLKQIKYVIKKLKEERLERLQERLEREKMENFYTCQYNCMRIAFDNAVEFKYKCPECGELLVVEDNSAKIKEIEKDIKEIEKVLKDVNKK
ncbi:hypothetical protein KY335_01265 [Candidatus Woesearchaeota archaeon]|nr:hypothetical protein [Candidatus Woesearchaeota archaeon]MBW3013854.1 hypothetical protein [Candidatus Woesearchaeota archaeon]